MHHVNAAKFISRYLPEPHESALGGEPAHHLFATAFAHWVCPPSGHSISWDDCYASANQAPLHHAAHLFLEPNGEARPLPTHLTAGQRETVERASRRAIWVNREAHRRGIR